MKKIKVISIPCPGEGHRTHLFVNGRYVLSIPGHSCDPGSFELFRHWSEVDQATLLYQGRELKDADTQGYLDHRDFQVAYGHQPVSRLIKSNGSNGRRL